jgi:hydroxymethylbilane synthase
VSGAIRLGTRGSALALRQTDLVSEALRRRRPDLRLEVVVLRADGDDDVRPVWRTDAPGIFTNTLTRALVRGEIDAAIHSLKDLPVRVGPATALAAILERDDAADVLIDRHQRSFEHLPAGAAIGSSSLRRRAQILARRPDLRVIEIRGSVVHRINQVSSHTGRLDAIVIAHAGVRRLDLAAVVSEVLPPEQWLPAPGQAAIAVETRAEDRPVRTVLSALDHAPTRIAVAVEREVLASLGAGCHAPVGAFARRKAGGHWSVSAAAWSHDGRRRARVDAMARLATEADAALLGRSIAVKLLERGAGGLVREGEDVHAGR